MKILSRPKSKQACEDIVAAALKILYVPSFSGPKYTVMSLMEYAFCVNVILQTLRLAGTIKSFTINDPRELKGSTYECERWLQHVGFSGDGIEHYIVELTYEFRRA